MDKKTASKFLKAFSDLEGLEFFREYVQANIDKAHLALEFSTEDTKDLQGQIKVWRKLLKLREAAVAVLHEGN